MLSSIYMLVCCATGKTYIGSTDLPLDIRFRIHASHYKRYNDGKMSYITSVEIFKQNDARIELLEEVENISSYVSEREAFYISTTQKCINKNLPCKHIYGSDYKRYYREYYQKNKEKLKEKRINKLKK